MAAHQRNRQTYGPETVTARSGGAWRSGGCLPDPDPAKARHSKQKRRFKTTTNSAHRLPVADNLLGQQFKVSQPNAVWVSDITYI